MALLERTFDRRYPTVRQELAAFHAEVRQLERRVAPASIVTSTSRRGHLLHVVVMSALAQRAAAGTNTVEAWTPW